MDYITVLPADVDLTTEHHYLRLPHPRTGSPQLYLPSSSTGKERILEVVRVNGGKRRTWFIDTRIDAGTMLIHHPIDPLFLIIPLVISLIPEKSASIPFQPLSSLLSTLSSSSSFALVPPFVTDKKTNPTDWNEDIAELLRFKSVKRVFKQCCEIKVISDLPPSPTSVDGKDGPSTRYYRPSMAAVLALLKMKVDWLAETERWDLFDHHQRQLAREGLEAEGVDAELLYQARIKSSIELMGQYLPPSVLHQLFASYDLKAYEVHLENMSAAALAASMPPTNLSNKSEKVAAGTKRKGASSRGVEALKKVNTASMNKLTSFFKPKPAEPRTA